MRSLICLLTLASHACALGILAIDYGASDFKASYVGAGTPFDVLYNKDSKRKTPSSVCLHAGERFIGADAVSMSTRYPLETFSGVKMLLGGDALQQQHAQLHGNVVSTDAKGRLTFQTPDKSTYSTQEIMAMQFATAKEMALAAAKTDKNFDTVITVPFFFDQVERQSVLDAAELAGLNVLSLVNDGAAVAVNFAMTRTFPESSEPSPEYHMFYDAGASSTRATIVSFQSASETESAITKNFTKAEIKGVGFSKAAGGFAIDLNIRDLLIQKFEEPSKGKLSTPLRENARAMAKLLKEAAKVKHVLSANSEAQARIENVAEDVDLRIMIRRDDVEQASLGLLPLFAQPMQDALTVANLTPTDLTSVILVGGASRIPMVQTTVKSIFPEDKIAQNLNADEAAVLGAVLYGAGISAQFRTKDIRVSDMLSHAVEISYEADKPKEDGSVRNLRSTLFSEHSRLGSRKTMTFRKSDNFTVSLSKPASDTNGPLPIADIHLKGINSEALNLTVEETSNSTVKCVLEADESGVVRVVEAIFLPPETKTPASMTDKFKNLFSSRNKTKDALNFSDNATDVTNDADLQAALDEILKRPSKVSLTITTGEGTSQSMTAAEKTAAKKRLRDLEQAEIKRKKREEARNQLESYIYKVRDHLSQQSYLDASTSNEQDKTKQTLEAASDWMYDASETAATTDLRAKRTDLEKLVSPVLQRISEASQRPAAVQAFSALLLAADGFHALAQANHTIELKASDLSRHSESDLQALADLINSTRVWFTEANTKQQKMPPNLDPVFLKADLDRRTRALKAEMERLRNKKMPRKPKTTSSASTESASSETATASSQETIPSEADPAKTRDEL